jgi:sugar/nucleoside kinase (ribokinase family)
MSYDIYDAVDRARQRGATVVVFEPEDVERSDDMHSTVHRFVAWTLGDTIDDCVSTSNSVVTSGWMAEEHTTTARRGAIDAFMMALAHQIYGGLNA